MYGMNMLSLLLHLSLVAAWQPIYAPKVPRWSQTCGIFMNANAPGPPVGSYYKTTVSFPMLGKQEVLFYVASRSRANLTLKGILNIDDVVEYSFDASGELTFQLSEKLQAKLDRFHCRLSSPIYDRTKDVSSIILHIRPLMLKKRVFMHRILNK